MSSFQTTQCSLLLTHTTNLLPFELLIDTAIYDSTQSKYLHHSLLSKLRTVQTLASLKCNEIPQLQPGSDITAHQVKPVCVGNEVPKPNCIAGLWGL